VFYDGTRQRHLFLFCFGRNHVDTVDSLKQPIRNIHITIKLNYYYEYNFFYNIIIFIYCIVYWSTYNRKKLRSHCGR
jgi:hypothetical protein